jgi:hemolysin activation/secretion protein
MNGLAAILLSASISAGALNAQSPPVPAPSEEQAKAQEERIRKLEEEVQALKAAQAAPKPEPPQLGGAGGSAAKAMNPTSA